MSLFYKSGFQTDKFIGNKVDALLAERMRDPSDWQRELVISTLSVYLNPNALAWSI